MPLEIVLVRHGQSEGNRDRVFTGHNPTALTELGRRQAEVTAHAVLARARRAVERERARAVAAGSEPPPAPPPIDEIITSDLVRAVATASPLGRLAGLPLVESAAVRERDVGAFTGLSFEEVQSRYPGGWERLLSRDPNYAPPGGESHVECGRRVARFIDDLCARRPHGRVVVFSHGVAINHMLRHIVGVSPDTPPRFFFQVENCSLHRVQRLDDGLLRVLATNDVAHLAAEDLLSYG